MSQSQSRSSLGQPRSTTALYQSASTIAHLPPSPQQEHTTTLSHKLRHMFDSSEYAVFLSNVRIHELGNVPQLEGEFAVRWKFRGRRPRGKVAGPRPKPSLPNLKLNQPLSSIHPSTSSLSLRSDSTDATTTTSTSSPIDSLHSTPSRPILNPSSSHLNRPPRANSIPPEVMTPIPTRRRFARVVEKKASDPTPLRQSIGSNGQLIPTSSPEVMEEPLEEQDLLSVEARKRKDSTESGRVVSKGSLGSNGPGSYPGSLLPAATIHDPQPSSSAASSQSHLNVSSRSHIDVSLPTPRPFPNHPPARSGTLPSPATLIDHIPTKAALNHPRPDSSSRTSSAMSATNRVISSSSNTALSSLNPLRRHGSTSGPGPPILQPDGPVSSGHRKGTTPAQRLKLHTCTWDYDLQHAMRIPLGRTLPVPPALSISALPGRSKGPAPILGAGPLSDSGIRLIIEQLPTTAATSVQGGIGANKESAGSMVQTVHHANHEKGNPSELGKAPKGSTDGEKSIFGMVDVDLAAFAGKGRTTRRFLLKGSKTNATVKLTVEMKWIGGEERWAAPPMQEGHHVTGVHDLVGTEAQDKIRNDLSLAKTPSSSGSSSSALSDRTHSVRSRASPQTMSRNVSSISLTGPVPNVGYKTFEHHLRPDGSGDGSRASRPSSKNHKYNKHTLSPVRFFRSNHPHHSHHIRDRDRNDITTPKSGIHELPPEVIIEAVFNPHPATEEGPFTFVPAAKGERLEHEDVAMDRVLEWADPSTAEDERVNGNGKEHKLGWGGRMRARKERKEKERQSKVVA